MPETQETKDDRDKASDKKKWRPHPWVGFVLYGLVVLTGLSIGSWYFKIGADRAKFWVEGLLSAGVLSVVIVQAVIYRKQWLAMERQWRDGQRAYVGIHSLTKHGDPHNRNPLLKIQNVGKTPADRVSVEILMMMLTPPVTLKIHPKFEALIVPDILWVDFSRTKLFSGGVCFD